MTTPYCECGCGTETRLAPQTHSGKGWVKGVPLRFAVGHAARVQPTEAFNDKWRVVESGCWEWGRALDISGYGVYWDGEKQRKAHVYSFERAIGSVPFGLQLDHLCRNRKCVNPDHLEAVTPWENTMRSNAVSAVNAAKSHCDHGHPFDSLNTYLHGGKRHCRTCRKEASLRRQSK